VAAQALERTQARQDLLQNVSMFSVEGVAAFLGTAASMADVSKPDIIPNLIIGAIGTPAVGTTSLIRAAATTAMKQAALGGFEEGLVQANTYQLRKDIGDTYELSEAAANVLAGMLLQGFIGTAMQSRGMYREVQQAREMVKRGEVNAEAQDLRDAVDALIRAVEDEEARGRTVMDATALPEQRPVQTPLDPPDPRAEPTDPVAREIKDSILQAAREDLLPVAGRKLTRGQRKALERERQELRTRLNRVTDDPAQLPIDPTDRNVSKRRQKRRAERKGLEYAEMQRQKLQRKIDHIERQLADNEVAAKAEADLTRIDQGIVPEAFMPQYADEVAMVNAQRMSMSEEAAPTQIMGPLDPLTPAKRAALDDLRLQRQMIDDLLLQAPELDVSAADARQWLDAQWLMFQRYGKEVPQGPITARQIVDAAERQPDAMPAPDAEIQTNLAEVVDMDRLTLPDRAAGPDDAPRLTLDVDPETGELELREVDWEATVRAEQERLNDIIARADRVAACVRE
jgi:hypothetical protein